MPAQRFDLVKNSPQGNGHNYAIEQGADYKLRIVFYDEFDAVRDLTTYTARMKIKQNVEDVADIDSFVSPTEITLGSTDPNFILDVANSVTANYDWNNMAVYDIELQSAGGFVERVMEGNVELSKQVTT